MMETAADQKLANGGGGVPWGTGLSLFVMMWGGGRWVGGCS